MRVKWAAAEGEIQRGASHGGAGNTERMGREVWELGVKRQRRRARRTWMMQWRWPSSRKRCVVKMAFSMAQRWTYIEDAW
jgi:hypothetical protein